MANSCGPNIPVRSLGDPGHIADHNKLHCFFNGAGNVNPLVVADGPTSITILADDGPDIVTFTASDDLGFLAVNIGVISSNFDVTTTFGITLTGSSVNIDGTSSMLLTSADMTLFGNGGQILILSPGERLAISGGSFEHLSGNVGFFGATAVPQPDSVSSGAALTSLGLATNVISDIPSIVGQDEGSLFAILPAFAGTDAKWYLFSDTPSVTGGSWTFTFDGVTSGAIPWDADGPTIQAIIDAMSNVDPGDIVVTPQGLDINNPYLFSFEATYGLQPIDASRITGNGALLTGPDSPYAVPEFLAQLGAVPLPVRGGWTVNPTGDNIEIYFTYDDVNFEVTDNFTVTGGQISLNALDGNFINIQAQTGGITLGGGPDGIFIATEDAGNIIVLSDGTFEVEAIGISLFAEDIGGFTADDNNDVKVSAINNRTLLLDTTFGTGDIRITSGDDVIVQVADDIELTCLGVGAITIEATVAGSTIQINGAALGFYGTAPVAQQTGVAVNIAAVHAALVALGLITA